MDSQARDDRAALKAALAVNAFDYNAFSKLIKSLKTACGKIHMDD